MLLEFLEGKTIHSGPTGGETPLKNHLPQIRELIGINNPGKKPEERKQRQDLTSCLGHYSGTRISKSAKERDKFNCKKKHRGKK